MPETSEFALQYRIGTSSLVHSRLKTDLRQHILRTFRNRRKGRKMGYDNWKRQKEFREKTDWEQAVCEIENTPEHVRQWMYESEHEIMCGDRLEGERSEPLDPVLDRRDKNASANLIQSVEDSLDRQMLKKEDRWLADIKNEELRAAVSKMEKSQQELIRLLLNGKTKHEAAQILGITDNGVQSRIDKIYNRLLKTLSPEAQRMLCQGRKR